MPPFARPETVCCANSELLSPPITRNTHAPAIKSGTSQDVPRRNGGLSVRVVRDKFLPNQGMRLSLRNAGLAAAILAPVVALATWPALVFTFDLSDPSKILTGVVTLGVIASLVGFAWFGGRELIMHASVRLVLAWTRQTPRDLAAFLDHCALELDFLRKVGGGWVFLHRYLLEYFAALEPAQMTREAGAP